MVSRARLRPVHCAVGKQCHSGPKTIVKALHCIMVVVNFRHSQTRMSKTRILLVCMGNICRSPTAEAVLRTQAERAGLTEKLEFDSAGTHNYHIGAPPDERSQMAALRRGYDLSALRARRVNEFDFLHFDLILAMDEDNLSSLRRACPPAQRHKLALLLDYAHNFDEREVPDPYYGGAAGFDHVLDLVEDAAFGLLAALSNAPIGRQPALRRRNT